MAIIASAAIPFPACPEGVHRAVCVDVVDLGIVTTNYAGEVKKQHKVYITWQTEEQREDGKYFLVSRRYTLSLHEKSTLRKNLESWRGRAFTSEEQKRFDLESLIGVSCLLNLIHNEANGVVYANVSAIMRLPRGMQPLAIDPSFVRMRDRPKEGAPDQPDMTPTDDDVPDQSDTTPTDDDVPF